MKRMAKGRKGGKSWVSVLLIIVAVVVWLLDDRKPGTAETAGDEAVSGRTITGDYEVFRDCRLEEARGNDGDSFLVRLPDGRKALFRLYFVDTPESAFKRYSSGETNYRRISDQARQMGGITPEQAVEVGQQAKKFTLGLLGRAPFVIHTRWDSPFNDDRYHAFVEVAKDGGSVWLHELLIENGLARIKTKPAELPDGTPAARQKERLAELQRDAKDARQGAWGMK